MKKISLSPVQASSQPSEFFVETALGNNEPRATVSGSCVPCMAAARDFYDKTHTQHVKERKKAELLPRARVEIKSHAPS